MKILLISLLLFSLLLSGCQGDALPVSNDAPTENTPATENVVYTLPDTSDLFSDRDLEAQYTGTPMVLSDATGSVTISQEGNYLLSGSLSDGMIVVDTDKESKVQLILDGVSIHNQSSATIYVKQADKVFITLAPESENSLSCGESYAAIDENNIDSVIFSKEDLTLNGTGKLTIQSPAGHGIVSKDDLRITGGSYSISSAGHAVAGKDAISIAAGYFAIDAGGDGFHADNNEDAALGNLYIRDGDFLLTSAGDGISSSAALQIDGGEFQIVTGGGSEYGEAHTDDMFGGGFGRRPGGMGGHPGGMEGPGFGSMEADSSETEDDTVSAKGIKSAGMMLLNGGSFQLNCADDAIHSNNELTIHEGSFTIASGDDGFHADETMVIENGTISITESYEGLEGLSITVNGGQITLKASDDGLNAAGGNDESGFGGMGGRPGGMGGFGSDRFGASSDSFITITGGRLFVDADGDGIDSNGNLTFTGGYTQVEGPTNGGNGPLDYGGTGSISGGTILITGSSGMAQSLLSTGNQGVLALHVGSCPAGTQILFCTEAGTQVMAVQPQKPFGCVIVSSPDLIKGERYMVQLGEQSQIFEAE